MNLVAVAEALTWQDGDALFTQVTTEHRGARADAVGSAAARCPAEVRSLLLGLDPAALDRLLDAPELARRLLYAGAPGDPTDFLADAVRAEAALAGTGPAPEQALWTALGDARIGPDGSVRRWPRPDSLSPLDAGSPWALAVDLSGQDDSVAAGAPAAAYGPEELTTVTERLAAAGAALAATSPVVAGFVRAFNQVLVVRPDPGAPDQLTSGSNGHYPGRTVVANAHLPHVGPAELADALVHEAVHALLYMEQYPGRWLRGEQAGAVTSPWTGTPLQLRQYLEACCVWFALVHL